jgi:hypothetical protein
MFSIGMGDFDVVLHAGCLHSLGPNTINNLYMIFTKQGKKNILKGIKPNSPKIIICRHMNKLLKKGHLSIIP